jgi:hypothetical protein
MLAVTVNGAGFMAGFSAGAAIMSGFRLIGRHPGVVLVWGLAYVAVALAPVIALFWRDLPTLLDLYARIMQSLASGAAPPVNDPDFVRQQGLLVAFEACQIGLNLLAVTLVSCAVYRAVLEPERKAFAYLRVGLQELWVLASLLGLVAVLVAVLVASSTVAGLIGQAAGPTTWTGGLIVFLASCGVVALVIWVALRLSLAAPMSFAERRFRLTEAWPLTRGHGWRLFGVAVGVVALTLLIQMVMATFAQALGVGAALGQLADLRAFLADPAAHMARVGPSLAGLAVLQVLVSALGLTLWATPFAEIYRELSGARPKPGTV